MFQEVSAGPGRLRHFPQQEGQPGSQRQAQKDEGGHERAGRLTVLRADEPETQTRQSDGEKQKSQDSNPSIITVNRHPTSGLKGLKQN